jgi:hypothetical protein
MSCKFCPSKHTRKHGLIKQKKTIKEIAYIFTYQRIECTVCYKNYKGELLKKEVLQESKDVL